MVRLDAYIVTHVGRTAIVQLDGGMLTVDDPKGLLVDGQRVQATAYPPGYTIAPSVLVGEFMVLQDTPTRSASGYPLGTPVLLQQIAATGERMVTLPIPLLLTSATPLPPQFFLAIAPTPLPDQVEDEGGTDPDTTTNSNRVGETCSHPLHVSPEEITAVLLGRRCP